MLILYDVWLLIRIYYKYSLVKKKSYNCKKKIKKNKKIKESLVNYRKNNKYMLIHFIFF